MAHIVSHQQPVALEQYVSFVYIYRMRWTECSLGGIFHPVFFFSSLNEVPKTDTMMDIVHLNITVLAIRNYTELPVSEDLNVPVLPLNHYKKNSWEE